MELLTAFADQLEVAKEGAEDGSLLLAASQLASRGRHGKHHSPTAIAAARIDTALSLRLAGAQAEDMRVWLPLYNFTRHQATDHWEDMADHVRDGYVGHHSQLEGQAHEWESRHRSYVRWVDYAKEKLEQEHLERHPSYNELKERWHHYRVVTALRAAHNSGSKLHAPLICEWLAHRDQIVAVEAANALAKHEGAFAEAHVVQQLRTHLAASPASHHWKPRVIRHLLEVSLQWSSMSEEFTSEAVSQLLKLETYAHGGGSPATACMVYCSRECNPHKAQQCHKECDTRCKAEELVAQLLKKVVRRGKDVHGHDVRTHAVRHHKEAHHSHHHLAQV